MTGTSTWIGKTRSLSLWSHINDYVTAYVSAHATEEDESWFKRWNELIDVHNITKKKKSFEFIAYIITGNPESTVQECLQALISLIPSLDSSIIVTNTNDNGDIQYIYKPFGYETSKTITDITNEEKIPLSSKNPFHTNDEVKNLQLQVQEFASKFENFGANQEKFDVNQEKLGKNQKKLLDNQEAISIAFYELLEKIENEKRAPDNESVSSSSILLEDSYSWIMVDPFSLSAFVGWLVFFIQIGCFFLAVFNTFITSRFTMKNVTVPKGVDRVVSAAQILIIFLILFLQQALWESMRFFSQGYTDDLRNQGIKRSWWFVSLSLRLLEGIVASFVTFWFVLQSDDVLDLLKDFTAIAFVSSFDNIIYILADMEMLGYRVKTSVDRMVRLRGTVRRMRSSDREERSMNSFGFGCIRQMLLHPLFFPFVLLVLMYSIWVNFVFIPQSNGEFLCEKLFLQLGDDVNFDLSYFSGSYEILRGKEKRGWFPAYREISNYETTNNQLEPKMILRFCESFHSWVLTFEKENFDEECLEKYAFIENSNVENQQKFDILEVPASDWMVKDIRALKWVPLENIVIDCDDEGPKYELHENFTCKSLVVDERKDNFISTRSWSTKFTIMENHTQYITVNDHPVYTNKKIISGEEQDIVLFLGLQWVMLSTNDLHDKKEIDLFSYLKTKFHAKWSDYTVAFFSKHVIAGTTEDTLTPVGLSWVMASPKNTGKNQFPEESRKMKSAFLCADCNDDLNPCFYGGNCLADYKCRCANGSTGALCQIPPTSNGYCNEYFNKEEFDFDGGDCCEHTCVSKTFQCGFDASGLFYVGYDSCHVDVCADCWRKSLPSKSMKGLVVTDMSLSSSGRVLGLIEPVGKTALVYDHDGSEWVMRGSAVMIVEEPSSSIIRVIGREDILNSDESRAPITVSIKTNEKVHVFDWDDKLWSECDSSIFNDISSPPIQLELKNNGNSLGVLYDNDLFRLFERDHRSLPWNDVSSYLNSNDKYKFISFSDDAKKIALSNDTCFELHNLLNHSMIKKCNMQEIKEIALSPSGQNLGILVDKRSGGEVLVFHVENYTFIERQISLRGMSVEGTKIEVSNDGKIVTSYSDMNNFIERNKFLNGKWQLIDRIPAKSMSLSSNEKVAATISITTGYPDIFHRTVFCEEGFSNIRLTFITDDRPNELMWEILNITTFGDISILKKGGPYEYAQATIIDDLCVDNHVINNMDFDSGGCIALRVVDLGREGLKRPGKIGISINGTMILTMYETDGYDNVYGIVGTMDCLKFMKEDLPWPRKYNPSLHMECFAVGCEWEPIGSVNRSSITTDQDKFLSMSADGLVVSIGYYKNNRVEIFKYNGSRQWTPHGANNVFMGQGDDNAFGYSTSVSADGSIVVVGDPDSNTNGIHSGQVVVFALNGTDNNWYQYGNAINGPQANVRIGWTVSLSADGIVFAAGTGTDLSLPCAVYVYEFCSVVEEWIQRGGCLGDERFESHVHVTLSSTGSHLVMAYPDAYTFGGLRVYKYYSLNKEWIPLGNDIQGDSLFQYLGMSSAISSDGSILAVAGELSYPAKTYVFDTYENGWRQMGQEISPMYGDCTDAYSTYGLSLSSDGSIWVISYCGNVRVLTYDKKINTWKESETRFPTVDFSTFYSLTASSADALTVATKGDNSIVIYHLSKNLRTTNKTCKGNEFDFTIQPDTFPRDIYWSLQTQTGEIVIGGKLRDNDAKQKNTFKYTSCLPYNSTPFYFYIEDEYGDGICCDWGKGHFTVKWNNETAMNHDDFKSKKSICLPHSSDLVIMSLHVFELRDESHLLVLGSSGNTLLSRKLYGNAGKNIIFDTCVPSNECIKIALANIEKVTVYFDNIIHRTFVPTTDWEIFHVGDCNIPSCRQNYSFLEMYFVTDEWPGEFSWELLNCYGEILTSEDDYAAIPYNIYHYQGCVAVPQNNCSKLMLYDSGWGDGGNFYKVSLNGTEIASGKQDTYELEFLICDVITACP